MSITDPRVEIVRHTGLPMSIAEMRPWFFWSRPDALGLSESDVRDVMAGTASDDQLSRTRAHANAAMDALLQAPIGESVRRPS